MNWLDNIILIGVLAVLNHVQFCNAQSQATEIKNEFHMNFLINGADKVTYSRSFNRHREFSYASCSATNNKICNVTLINANSTNFSKKTCQFELDPFESTELGIASLLLPDDETPKNQVAVEWYRVDAQDHLDSFMTFLSMTDCKGKTNHFIGSIDEIKGKPTHVILYRYPKIVTSASMRYGRRLLKEYEFGQPAHYVNSSSKNMKYIGTNHTSVCEEQPVELGTSQGFFFTATNYAPFPNSDVMYTNLTTMETKMLGHLNSIIDPTDLYPKTSGAYNKYGLCWMKLKKDSPINCTQFLVNGQRSINEVSLKISEPVDWLAVHNLRESAMLLVTGQCYNGHCDRFKLTKIHADGHTSTPLEMNNLNATCPDKSLHLSMDVTEAHSKKDICFHFVCLENRYWGLSNDKTSTSLQYRRKCIDQGVIAKLN